MLPPAGLQPSLMTVIFYRGQAVAMAGRERFYLVPRIAGRADGDPIKTFVCFVVVYARDVLAGRLPDEPRRYLPAGAERFAREFLLPPRAFRALAGHSDAALAQHLGVPREQITQRRVDLAAQRRRSARRRAACPSALRGSRPRLRG